MKLKRNRIICAFLMMLLFCGLAAPALADGEAGGPDEAYLLAQQYLKDEKYYSAYESFLASSTPGAYEQALECVQAWPKNGEIWRVEGGGKGDPFQLTIRVNQDEDQATVLRFMRRNFHISTVFIGGSDAVTVQLPAGIYGIKTGVGCDWYGVKESFGPGANYQSMVFSNNNKKEFKLDAGGAWVLTLNTEMQSPGADELDSVAESWEDFSK